MFSRSSTSLSWSQPSIMTKSKPNLSINLSEDHPYALEIKSLRSALAIHQVSAHNCPLQHCLTYTLTLQHEAHESSLKLQKHSLDSARLHERTRELESENERLKGEMIVLRDHPDDQPHPDTFRLKELEIEYRRLRDQVACVFPCITTTPFQLYFTTMP